MVSTKGRSKRRREMDGELLYISQEGSMRVTGLRTRERERASNSTAMVINTKENLRMANQRGKESTSGALERYMMGSGNKDSNMVMESGEELTESLTLETGYSLRLMGMASTLGSMEINMKDSGRTV